MDFEVTTLPYPSEQKDGLKKACARTRSMRLFTTLDEVGKKEENDKSFDDKTKSFACLSLTTRHIQMYLLNKFHRWEQRTQKTQKSSDFDHPKLKIFINTLKTYVHTYKLSYPFCCFFNIS